MSNLPPVVSLALLIGTVCSITWIFAEIARRSTIRGSHGRYVWASVERATRWPCLTYLAVSAVLQARFGIWLQAGLDCVGVALWIWIYSTRDADDDDFWKGLAGRLKSWGLRASGAAGTA